MAGGKVPRDLSNTDKGNLSWREMGRENGQLPRLPSTEGVSVFKMEKVPGRIGHPSQGLTREIGVRCQVGTT